MPSSPTRRFPFPPSTSRRLKVLTPNNQRTPRILLGFAPLPRVPNLSRPLAPISSPMAATATAAPRGRQPQARGVDDENLVFEMSPGVEAITSFDQMGICNDLLRGIYAYGFEKPSALLSLLSAADAASMAPILSKLGIQELTMAVLAVISLTGGAVAADLPTPSLTFAARRPAPPPDPPPPLPLSSRETKE